MATGPNIKYINNVRLEIESPVLVISHALWSISSSNTSSLILREETPKNSNGEGGGGGREQGAGGVIKSFHPGRVHKVH